MCSLQSPDIVVSGYGCISAAGADAQESLINLVRGEVRNSVKGEGFFPGSFSAPCFVVHGKSNNSFLLSQGVNRTLQLALKCIEDALVVAGMDLRFLQGKRVGIAMGTTVGCTFHNEEYYKVWKSGGEPDNDKLITYLSSNLAERIQKILGVKGPRAVITNACASATDAIGVAKTWLEHGMCDIAIAGGADELSRIACHGFRSLMLISDESCMPFDGQRKGLNLGEGAGLFIMETESHATDRRGEIFGRVLGYGIACDAYHLTAPHPQGRGLQLAVKMALENGGLDIDDLAMINAHGTGTPANDLAEVHAIESLGVDTGTVPVVSTKGATGHTLGAAGGIEAVFTLMALNNKEVVGTVGCKQRDKAFSIEVLQHGQLAPLKGRIGMSQSLAFGGSNGALILEGVGS